MRNFTVIFLLIGIIAASLKDIAVYIDFKSNQDFYTKAYCINLQKPELMCFATCYLKDQMQDNVDEKQIVPTKMEMNTIMYILPYVYSFPVFVEDIFEKTPILYTSNLINSSFVDKLLQPPRNIYA